MKRRTTVLLLGIAAVLTGALARTALAYFTSGGAGSGGGTVGTAQSVTVQAVSTGSPGVLLSPGTTGDLLVKVSNPNSTTVTITGIQQNGTLTTVGGVGTCTAAGSGVSVLTQAGLSVSVAPGTHVVTISNGVSMSNAAATGCQGASFQIPVVITVRQG